MKIKRMLLLLTVTAVLAFAAGCDPKDGNTSGSAESNGMISDPSDDRVNSGDHVTDTSGDHTTSDETSEGKSDGLGDDLSDVVSDAGDAVSDVVSDVEDGASDLFGDDGSDTNG